MAPERSTPIVESLPFCVGIAVTTLLNVLVIGLEADLGCMFCEPEDRVGIFVITDALFALLFGVDLVFRIVVGQVDFFMSRFYVKCKNQPIRIPHFVNLLDILLVLCRCLGLAFSGVEGMEGLKLVSMFRVYHCASVFNGVRLVRLFREIVLMVDVSVVAAKLIVCFVILLLPLTWATAIVMTITIGQNEAGDRIDYTESIFTVADYWGTVPKSAFTLFQIITLDGWSSGLASPIFREYPSLSFVIMPFLGVMFFSMLNVLISTVVASTLATGKALDGERDKESENVKKRVMESMRLIFAQCDADKGGELDRVELENTREMPEVKDRLDMLGLPVSDLDWVFELLDEDEQSDSVELETFFRSCSRLEGPAMARDLQNMSVDLGRHFRFTDGMIGSLDASNKMLESLVKDVAGVDREILKGSDDHKDPVLEARRARRTPASTAAKLLLEHVRARSKSKERKLSRDRSRPRISTSTKSTTRTAKALTLAPAEPPIQIAAEPGPISESQALDYNAIERNQLMASMIERFGEVPPPPPPVPATVRRPMQPRCVNPPPPPPGPELGIPARPAIS